MAGELMGLIIIGIDEAGYGPMLGPLSVGMCACRVDGWKPGDAAPDLWEKLSPTVCRSLKDWRAAKCGPIPVADSKTLKLANGDGERSPTMHLERGVLCFMKQLHGVMPSDDAELARLLGTRWPMLREEDAPAQQCFAGEALALPAGWTSGQLAIAGAQLQAAMDKAGVSVVAMQCRMVEVARFNAIVRETGSKGQTTLEPIGEYLRWAWQTQTGGSDAVSVVCDRLGGRERYGATLAQILHVPIEAVGVVEEAAERSRYVVQLEGRKLHISFAVEGEKQHVPIAMASMTAKWVRELAMARFNRYWRERAEHEMEMELKPTAGYTTDARRWLRDASSMLTSADKEALIRIA